MLGFSTSNQNPNPAGDTIASIFGSAFTDTPGIATGVAIAAQAGTSVGTWQYSTDGGATWTNLPAVSLSSALLLSASARLRFVPNKSFSGTVSLTAYAWDGSGNFTGTANLTQTGIGGITPFSATTLVANCLVNSAPTLT